MEPDDRRLMEALQSGDDSALDQIMARYREPIFGFAFRQLANESAAADVAQETFVRVYVHRTKFKPHGTFRSWLYRIASNLCVDHARRLWRTQGVSLDAKSESGTEHALGEFLVATDLAPDLAAAAASDIAELQTAIAELPQALREPLVLFALEDRSQQECAELLGISARAVETKVARARALLKTRLSHLLR